MTELKFYDDTHRARFEKLVKAYAYNDMTDSYRTSLAYLIALTDDTYTHRRELYDEQTRAIIPDGLQAAFQTGTTTRLTLLAFNLFTSSTAFCPDEMRVYLTPDYIFESNLAAYFVEALKIRHPHGFCV